MPGQHHLLWEPEKTRRGLAAQSSWKKRRGKSRWEVVHSLFLRKRKASRISASETADIGFHVHTELTWALAPGWIRGRGGVFRIMVASRLIFLTNGFHLFKERTILFKTELDMMSEEGN